MYKQRNYARDFGYGPQCRSDHLYISRVTVRELDAWDLDCGFLGVESYCSLRWPAFRYEF